MNNQIASPCCGSCGWYCWNGRLLKYTCHNPEIVKQHKQNTFKPESLCVPNYYSPRNPVLITDLSGVKELIEAAYRAGVINRLDWPFDNTDDLVAEYMKTLEDK